MNGADTVTYDAAILSQAVGKPVRVQLTRKDEMAFENYGPAYRDRSAGSARCQREHRRVGSRVVVAGLGRPSGNQPAREHHHGFAAGIPAGGLRAAIACSRAGDAFNNNSNGVPSYFAARHRGRCKVAAC